MRQLVDTKNAQEFGFETPAQLQQAKVGQPMLDFLIRLDELRNYQGQDPAELLHPTGQVVYPVTFEGQTRSSITLVRQANIWRAVSIGESQLAKARSRVQEGVALQMGMPGGATDTFQVRIPALNAVFVGNGVSGSLMLTLVATVPDLGVETGSTMPAREVLERAQQLARQIDPNAPR
jgi:hypothetical protein